MLDREPRASEVVPQLKRMKEDRLALLKAIQSSDPDLGGYQLQFPKPLFIENS